MELGQEHVSRSNDEAEVRKPSWQKSTAACLCRVNSKSWCKTRVRMVWQKTHQTSAVPCFKTIRAGGHQMTSWWGLGCFILAAWRPALRGPECYNCLLGTCKYLSLAPCCHSCPTLTLPNSSRCLMAINAAGCVRVYLTGLCMGVNESFAECGELERGPVSGACQGLSCGRLSWLACYN